MGTTGDSYHNAIAGTIIGLLKAEVIHAGGSWRCLDPVEYATLERWTGSAIAVSSIPSVACHQPGSKQSTIVSHPVWPSRPDPNPIPSENSGRQIEGGYPD